MMEKEIIERRVYLTSYKLGWIDDDQFGRIRYGNTILRGTSLSARYLQGKTEASVNCFDKTHCALYAVDGSYQLVCSFDFLDDEIDSR